MKTEVKEHLHCFWAFYVFKQEIRNHLLYLAVNSLDF